MPSTHFTPWLQRPAFPPSDDRHFTRVLHRALHLGAWPTDADVTPLWPFLCWLTDTRGLLLHGSGVSGLTELKPRRASDVSPFGAQEAVYAASDGLWSMFFAILDRERVPMTLANAAVRFEHPQGEFGATRYFFSITADALKVSPFKEGCVYVLTRDAFHAEPPRSLPSGQAWTHQWAATRPVRPLFSVPVRPSDFPFLQDIRAHEDTMLAAPPVVSSQGIAWVETA
ncbi:hypothetical protein [Deinococcus yavapaiensis]|uniref:Uncharacterized protein n=1 Tax=Deinococcus yavapaiensis KR-236 TaxID=694435 RepID=A0A318S7T5_9DEIO|nr:hypothetical protein [Deinococcus yavapaiensis]PYE51831.1 hypothetical protein DES52_11432 [Deinococcus yavapaiensis KR-236]